MQTSQDFVKNASLQGSCLCSAVRYTIDGLVKNIACCHCFECRKQSGLYYAAIETIRSALNINGEENISQYRSSEGACRKFCKHCGSALFFEAIHGDQVFVLAGSVDGETGLEIRSHIYCDEKADFYELPDQGVKFAKSREHTSL